MELANTRIVPAPPAGVWRALNDPDVLRACIPGCESLQRSGDNEYRASLVTRIGPVSAKFAGRMTMTDIDSPNAYTLRFEGQGGAAGFANGEARVSLSPADGGQTSMAYAVKAQVGGKIAQLGSRLIDGVAAKLADDFFTNFTVHFSPPAATGADVAKPLATASPAGAGADEDAPSIRVRESGTWTRFIAIAAIIVILAFLYFNGARLG
ncbi:MAG: carbon monoxide dehydrogenase subunit G [Betaproteobacteria bacterium]